MFTKILQGLAAVCREAALAVPPAVGISARPHSNTNNKSVSTPTVTRSVADPDPNPHVFGPPGSGSISQRYGSGSFYHHAKIVRKTLIPTIL
jgi:hypothetical protein